MVYDAVHKGFEVSELLVCEWNWKKPRWFHAGVRVVVDEANGTVTFEHCHRPNRFWAIRTDATYTCRLDELLAVHLDWWFMNEASHGRDVTISTPAGKATFNSKMAGFHEVVAVLRKHVGKNHGPLLDNPNVWLVGIILLALAICTIGLLWAIN